MFIDLLNNRRPIRSIVLLAISSVAGCTAYHAQPTKTEDVNDRLKPPETKSLQTEVNKIHHPLLSPVELSGDGSITPDQAAVIAVIVNPALRAQRDQHQVAAAQAFAAGILPNPQFGWSENFPNGGNWEGTTNEYSLGLSWDVTELISHGAKVSAAQRNLASVDLAISWQEWQTAQAAKMAAYDLAALIAQLDLAKQIDQSLSENVTITKAAEEHHDKTVLDLSAAEAASTDAHTAVLSAERDVRHQQLVLNRAIGLPPETKLNVKVDDSLPQVPDEAFQNGLVKELERRRIDLVALKIGYESEEETLRAAVLAQFPKVNIGFNKSRDNSNVRSLGFSLAIDIPIFDRNQGNIANETATRQRLYDEYVQRVFEARSDVAQACDDMAAIHEQLKALEESVPSLQKLVDLYKQNLDQGNADVLSYYTAISTLASKKLAILKLKQQLIDNRSALELASGCYMPSAAAPSAKPKGE